MSADDSGFRRLGRAVRDAQAPLVDAAAAAVQARHDALPSRATGSRWRVLAVAASVVAVVGGAVVARRATEAPQLRFEVGDRAGAVGEWVANSAEVPLAFSDGSSVLLHADTRAQVTTATARGATVRIERGRVSASIVHSHDTSWTFEVGPYEVLVIGTRFDASWDPVRERFELNLLEGSVVASGPQLARQRVVAGQQLQATPTVDAPPTGPAEPPAPPAVVPEPVVVVPPAAPRGPLEPTWVRALREGDEATAVDEVERSGLVRSLERRSAKELLLLADAARRVGHPATSATAYQAVRTRFIGSPESARAAFGLGLLQPPGVDARRWFSTYLREAPEGSLAREALGRLLETQLTDEPQQAKQTAQRYLERWPEGPHARLARKALE